MTTPVLLACLALPAADVRVARDADGGYTAAAPEYTARVGPDGNLRSLVAGGTEFLAHGTRGLVGGGYQTLSEGGTWSARAFAFAAVRPEGPDTLVATAPGHTLTYRFLPGTVELVFDQRDEPTVWGLAVNPAVRDVVDTVSGEPVPPRVLARETTPRVCDAAGAGVTLPPGTTVYTARGSRTPTDADPLLHQIWSPRNAAGRPTTRRITVRSKPTTADALRGRLVVAPANHIVPAEKVEVGLDAELRFPGLTVEGTVTLVVRDAVTKAKVFGGERPLRLGEKGSASVRFVFRLPPGFYEADLTAAHRGEAVLTRHFPLARGPAGMTPPARPDDFDRFWDETLAEQERVPANLRLTPEKAEPTHTLYRAEFDGLLGRRFHAWLSVPAKPGRYPARLTLPPSGINPPYPPATGPGVVGMSLAIAGQEVLPPPGGYARWDYWRAGIDRRETWYYRAVFAACSRAVDLLAARPEVDPARITVHGGSQGGGLTFVTAGLNPKVGLAVSGSPGLFGLEWKLRHLGPAFWPPIDLTDGRGQLVTPPPADALDARAAVVRYFDAAHFAPRVRCPVLLNVGLQDVVTSPAGVLACWSRLDKVPLKGLLADPWGGHNGPRGGQGLQAAWTAALESGDWSRARRLTEAEGLPVIVEAAGPAGR